MNTTTTSREDRVTVPIEGGSLGVRRWRGPHDARRAVVCIHGMMSHAGWFAGLADALGDAGVTVYGMDRRGSGEARGASRTFELEAWLDDISKVVARAREDADDVSLFCWCWGSKTGTIALDRGLPVSRVVYAAPALRMVDWLVRNFQAADKSKEELPLPFDPIDDFADLAEIRAFIADDRLRWRTMPRRFLGPDAEASALAMSAIARLPVPAMLLLASNDKLVDNPATRALFDGQRVESLPGSHAIVLEYPKVIAGRMLDFGV